MLCYHPSFRPTLSPLNVSGVARENEGCCVTEGVVFVVFGGQDVHNCTLRNDIVCCVKGPETQSPLINLFNRETPQSFAAPSIEPHSVIIVTELPALQPMVSAGLDHLTRGWSAHRAQLQEGSLPPKPIRRIAQ